MSVDLPEELLRIARIYDAAIDAFSPARLERNYRAWLSQLLPQHFRGADQFAEHHEQFWEWAWPIADASVADPPAYLAIWPRGGNKSTTAEAFAVAAGARGRRKFGLYICRTQDQADSHVSSISSMILNSNVADYYPDMANPKMERVGGHQRQAAWNRSVLTTASGFTMQGYGLQSAFRGVRVEEYRPDLIIISDIDDIGDSPSFVKTLLGHLAGSVLPTAANHCVYLFEQNLIHHNSMMNQVLTRETDVLSDRVEGGPVPAVRDIRYARKRERWFITGTPTWVGQDLAACEGKVNTFGKDYFERECQHNVNMVLGRQRFDPEAIDKFAVEKPTIGELRLTTDAFSAESIAFYPCVNGALAIWKRPERNHVYGAGADTAEGRDVAADVSTSADPDYSVAQIRDAHSGEQVARLRGRLTEGAFGEALYALLRWYNSPFLVPEVKGGYGRAMLNKLLDLGYEQELIWNKHMLNQLPGTVPYTGSVAYLDLGFDTNAGRGSRPTLVQKLDDAILLHTIETHDAVTVEEYRHFCYNTDGKPEAEAGYHDDCVISDALCVLAIDRAIYLAVMRRGRQKRATEAVPYARTMRQRLRDSL